MTSCGFSRWTLCQQIQGLLALIPRYRQGGGQEQALGILRLFFKDQIGLGFGLIQFSRHQKQLAQHDLGLYQVGVKFHRLGQRPKGALKTFQFQVSLS